MKKLVDWDENVVHRKLQDLVNSGLDKNGRYRDRPLESAEGPTKTFTRTYIDTQCLLTEWLTIYHALRAYSHFLLHKFEGEAAVPAKQQADAAN